MRYTPWVSWTEYQEECIGCQPVLVNVKTHQPYPTESPEMQAVLTVFNAASREEKVAFHNVTCNSSTSPGDGVAFRQLTARIQAALKALAPKPSPG